MQHDAEEEAKFAECRLVSGSHGGLCRGMSFAIESAALGGRKRM